ncbi:MAG: hypothetical protein U0169_12920 [Polyangiaceae bacterium]
MLTSRPFAFLRASLPGTWIRVCFVAWFLAACSPPGPAKEDGTGTSGTGGSGSENGGGNVDPKKSAPDAGADAASDRDASTSSDSGTDARRPLPLPSGPPVLLPEVSSAPPKASSPTFLVSVIAPPASLETGPATGTIVPTDHDGHPISDAGVPSDAGAPSMGSGPKPELADWLEVDRNWQGDAATGSFIAQENVDRILRERGLLRSKREPDFTDDEKALRDAVVLRGYVLPQYEGALADGTPAFLPPAFVTAGTFTGAGGGDVLGTGLKPSADVQQVALQALTKVRDDLSKSVRSWELWRGRLRSADYVVRGVTVKTGDTFAFEPVDVLAFSDFMATSPRYDMASLLTAGVDPRSLPLFENDGQGGLAVRKSFWSHLCTQFGKCPKRVFVSPHIRPPSGWTAVARPPVFRALQFEEKWRKRIGMTIVSTSDPRRMPSAFWPNPWRMLDYNEPDPLRIAYRGDNKPAVGWTLSGRLGTWGDSLREYYDALPAANRGSVWPTLLLNPSLPKDMLDRFDAYAASMTDFSKSEFVEDVRHAYANDGFVDDVVATTPWADPDSGYYGPATTFGDDQFAYFTSIVRTLGDLVKNPSLDGNAAPLADGNGRPIVLDTILQDVFTPDPLCPTFYAQARTLAFNPVFPQLPPGDAAECPELAAVATAQRDWFWKGVEQVFSASEDVPPTFPALPDGTSWVEKYWADKIVPAPDLCQRLFDEKINFCRATNSMTVNGFLSDGYVACVNNAAAVSQKTYGALCPASVYEATRVVAENYNSWANIGGRIVITVRNLATEVITCVTHTYDNGGAIPGPDQERCFKIAMMAAAMVPVPGVQGLILNLALQTVVALPDMMLAVNQCEMACEPRGMRVCDLEDDGKPTTSAAEAECIRCKKACYQSAAIDLTSMAVVAVGTHVVGEKLFRSADSRVPDVTQAGAWRSLGLSTRSIKNIASKIAGESGKFSRRTVARSAETSAIASRLDVVARGRSSGLPVGSEVAGPPSRILAVEALKTQAEAAVTQLEGGVVDAAKATRIRDALERSASVDDVGLTNARAKDVLGKVVDYLRALDEREQLVRDASEANVTRPGNPEGNGAFDPNVTPDLEDSQSGALRASVDRAKVVATEASGWDGYATYQPAGYPEVMKALRQSNVSLLSTPYAKQGFVPGLFAPPEASVRAGNIRLRQAMEHAAVLDARGDSLGAFTHLRDEAKAVLDSLGTFAHFDALENVARFESPESLSALFRNDAGYDLPREGFTGAFDRDVAGGFGPDPADPNRVVFQTWGTNLQPKVKIASAAGEVFEVPIYLDERGPAHLGATKGEFVEGFTAYGQLVTAYVYVTKIEGDVMSVAVAVDHKTAPWKSFDVNLRRSRVGFGLAIAEEVHHVLGYALDAQGQNPYATIEAALTAHEAATGIRMSPYVGNYPAFDVDLAVNSGRIVIDPELAFAVDFQRGVEAARKTVASDAGALARVNTLRVGSWYRNRRSARPLAARIAAIVDGRMPAPSDPVPGPALANAPEVSAGKLEAVAAALSHPGGTYGVSGAAAPDFLYSPTDATRLTDVFRPRLTSDRAVTVGRNADLAGFTRSGLVVGGHFTGPSAITLPTGGALLGSVKKDSAADMASAQFDFPTTAAEARTRARSFVDLVRILRFQFGLPIATGSPGQRLYQKLLAGPNPMIDVEADRADTSCLRRQFDPWQTGVNETYDYYVWLASQNQPNNLCKGPAANPWFAIFEAARTAPVERKETPYTADDFVLQRLAATPGRDAEERLVAQWVADEANNFDTQIDLAQSLSFVLGRKLVAASTIGVQVLGNPKDAAWPATCPGADAHNAYRDALTRAAARVDAGNGRVGSGYNQLVTAKWLRAQSGYYSSLDREAAKVVTGMPDETLVLVSGSPIASVTSSDVWHQFGDVLGYFNFVRPPSFVRALPGSPDPPKKVFAQVLHAQIANQGYGAYHLPLVLASAAGLYTKQFGTKWLPPADVESAAWSMTYDQFYEYLKPSMGL